MKRKAIIVSGYFNPIHKGHLEYFNNAKAMGDELFVIVNNDHQRVLKGSKEFQQEEKLLSQLQEERLAYAGSIVLGLNDALVELTGALAGLTLALQSNRPHGD